MKAMKLAGPKSLLIWIGCVLAGALTCYAADPPSAEGVLYFEKHVRPLLAKRCYSCHSSRTKKQEGGLLLDRRAGWAVGGDSGPAVIPGNTGESLLIRAVRYEDSSLQMPPDRPLSQEQVARLEHWVRIGAPDPRDESMERPMLHADPSDPVAGRQHWAFQPFSEAPPPTIAARTWPRSRIDSLVLSRLEAENLRPAPDADRRTLLRRIYFRLIGLPPTPTQVAAFLDDPRPGALENVVARLLSSPHFGERWGRHWLDLARYADSNGLDENFLFREAWRYRNWVIAALNADTPFDRFVMEQVAGDLLPHDSIDQRDQQRIAAGFLVVGPKVLLGVDSKRQQMEVADEQLDTIGRAILGQTLGCARCHDHKFDPVPTADYYALAGIMTSTQVMEQRYMLGSQRVMEQLVGLGPNGDESDKAYEQYWRDRPRLTDRRKRAKSAFDLLTKGNTKAFDRLAKEHAGAVAAGAADASRTIEQRMEAQQALLDELSAAIANPPKIPARAMIPCDCETPADEHIRLAGQFDRLGDRVPRGFLRVLSRDAVAIPDGQSGRVELGRWLTDVERGAGRLAARVLANRVWYHLMGRGIVRTVDNFGRTGEPPTHPGLLDHLAGELIDSGWSIKHLIRVIILSRSFAMSSRHDEAAHAVDPENRLLWRAHRRRLDPEALRDSILTAAGELDVAPMDSTVWYLGDQATAVGANKNRRRTDFPCRSVYLPVIRNDLPELFEVFDFADPHTTTGMRSETTVATQGLFILNDASVMAASDSVARHVLASSKTGQWTSRVDKMFELVLNSSATDEEQAELRAFIGAMRQRLAAQGDEAAELRAWSMACHALFASSRFQILE